MYICFLRSLHAFLSADYKKIIETIEAVKYSSYSVPSSWWWWHLWCWPAHSPLHSGSPGAGFPKCSTLCPPPIHQSLRENSTAQLSKALLSWGRGGTEGQHRPRPTGNSGERPSCCFVPCHSNVSLRKRGARTLSSRALASWWGSEAARAAACVGQMWICSHLTC